MAISLKFLYFVVNLNLLLAYALSQNVRLIQRFNDEIESGNYTYYQLNEKGNYKIELISEAGDADLYASSKTRYVTFSNYELQSTTFGTDEIYLSNSFKRPITIGVYGHPFQRLSKYKLNIYQILIAINDENNEQVPYEEYTRLHNNYEQFSSISTYSDLRSSNADRYNHEKEKYTSNANTNKKAENVRVKTQQKSNHEVNDADEEEGESVLKTIAIFIFKIITEILLN